MEDTKADTLTTTHADHFSDDTTSVDDASPGDGSATADKQAVFRFADLPDTIRKDIYELVLCSWAPAPVASSVSLELLGGFFPASALTLLESPCVAILGVNRAIYDEAREVMCKKSSFIKIDARLPFEEMCKLLVLHQLPIRLLTKSALRNFRDAVLVHKIAREDNKKELHGQDFIFLSRDLKVFIEMLRDAWYAYCFNFCSKKFTNCWQLERDELRYVHLA